MRNITTIVFFWLVATTIFSQGAPADSTKRPGDDVVPIQPSSPIAQHVKAIPLKDWQAAEFKAIEKAKADFAAKADQQAEDLFLFILKDSYVQREAILPEGVRLSGDTLFITLKGKPPAGKH